MSSFASPVRRLVSALVLVASLLAFAATSPPAAYDEEKGEASLTASAPSVARTVGLEVDLQGAFGSETIDFSCGMAWEEGVEPVLIEVTVRDLDAPADAPADQQLHTMRVQSSVGTQYEDGSRTPGPRALVTMPIPCEGDVSCSRHYAFTCTLPEPPADRAVKVEWYVGAHVRYDPGGFCGGDRRTTLDVTSEERSP